MTQMLDMKTGKPVDSDSSVDVAPVEGEQTPAQQAYGVTGIYGRMATFFGRTYKSYRNIRRDPTIALGRAMFIAMIVFSEWSVEADDDAPKEWKKLVQDTYFPLREEMLENCIKGMIDFGWAPFEQIWDTREVVIDMIDPEPPEAPVPVAPPAPPIPPAVPPGAPPGAPTPPVPNAPPGVIQAPPPPKPPAVELDPPTPVYAMRLVLCKAKPLLQDITDILTVEENGAFAGFKNGAVQLGVTNSLIANVNVEGTNHYGEAILENCRRPYMWWEDANEGAARYDRKVAGSHWVVYYPPGKTDGVDNKTHAETVLRMLESSGCLAIPNFVQQFITTLQKNPEQADAFRWKVEMVTGSQAGQQPQFVERLNYLDALKVRGLTFPERMMLQGQHGTLAEAGAHGDIGKLNAEYYHHKITRYVQEQSVNVLLVQNYGPNAKNKVRLTSSSISDDKLTRLSQIYIALLQSARGVEEADTIDTNILKDDLGIPKAKELAPMNDAPVPYPDPTDPPQSSKDAAAGAEKIAGGMGQ